MTCFYRSRLQVKDAGLRYGFTTLRDDKLVSGVWRRLTHTKILDLIKIVALEGPDVGFLAGFRNIPIAFESYEKIKASKLIGKNPLMTLGPFDRRVPGSIGLWKCVSESMDALDGLIGRVLSTDEVNGVADLLDEDAKAIVQVDASGETEKIAD